MQLKFHMIFSASMFMSHSNLKENKPVTLFQYILIRKYFTKFIDLKMMLALIKNNTTVLFPVSKCK